MCKKEWSATLGRTAGCTMRLSKCTEYSGHEAMDERKTAKDESKRELYYGDSWFTSVKLLIALMNEYGHEYFGALKTNKAGAPKDEIEELMKEWNAGSYLVMECEEHRLWIIGYKYSYKKKGEKTILWDKLFAEKSYDPLTFHITVCVFLGTWNSGSSTLGEPYIAKWPDKLGNVKYRKVDRPDAVSRYFKRSNMIDRHNQLRQSELALEQLWLTKDPWFRINTTVFGMTVTDAYLLAKYSSSTKSGIKSMSIQDFATRVAYDLFEYKSSDQPCSEILDGNNTSLAAAGVGTSTSLQRREPITWQEAMLCHQIDRTPQVDGRGDASRRQCRMKQSGCQGSGSDECQHEGCRRSVTGATNRHGPTYGIFICRNILCQQAHWINIAEQSNCPDRDP